MSLLVIGPITKDKIIKNGKETTTVGGSVYYESYVFNALDIDYIPIINLKKEDSNLIAKLPNPKIAKTIFKEDTHYFINSYPNKNNLDLRIQYSNFPNIAILKEDLDPIIANIQNIDGIILNPLNKYDFPLETIKYLRNVANKHGCLIYLSAQGFLKDSTSDSKVILKESLKLNGILELVDILFLDENEFKLINDFNLKEAIITNGSKGSRILYNNKETAILPVKPTNIIDSTGCGDTYMAAYISKRIDNSTIEEAGNFASKIASRKLECSGPFKL